MKPLIIAIAALVSATSFVTAADAQGYGANRGSMQGQQNNGNHRGWGQEQQTNHNWRRGERMGYNNWQSAQRVDYRQHHLRRPPSGYEWRQSNGQYVLAAVATGLIASIILSSGR
ncbi:MAG: RcnB family protein [Alphaproteobacteria bacterium]